MGKQNIPIKLNFARKYFRLLFDAIDIGIIEFTDHFRRRQKKRKISLADIEPVIRNGHIQKQYPPREDDPDFRWSLVYKGVTLIFKLTEDYPPRVVFKTCWRGSKPNCEKL